MSNKINILGVNIDDISLSEAENTVQNWLLSSKEDKHYIVTPNPEFLVLAQQDPEFKRILNSADLAIPDGVGLKLTGKIKNSLAGVDLMDRLLVLSNEKGFRIGLIGGLKNLAEELSERLKSKYKNLKIVYVDSNFLIDKDGQELISTTTLPETGAKKHKIDHPGLYNKIDILFVAFGQGKQEKWIAKNINKLNAKVLMGVGGAFEYLSGRVSRAPLTLRKLGLEWMYRLITQPWRIKRQLSLLKYLWLIAKT